MAINAGYTRRTELRCTLAEMATYGAVVPYDGEAVYVQQSDGSYAIKMGDGKTPLADLPYVVNYKAIDDMRKAAETAKAGAEAAVASLDIGLSVIDGELCIEFEEE